MTKKKIKDYEYYIKNADKESRELYADSKTWLRMTVRQKKEKGAMNKIYIKKKW